MLLLSSQGFSRSSEEMIFRAIDVQLLVKLAFIYDVPQEFMTLTQIDTLKICFLLALDSASDLISKNEKNRYSRCCCYQTNFKKQFFEA